MIRREAAIDMSFSKTCACVCVYTIPTATSDASHARTVVQTCLCSVTKESGESRLRIEISFFIAASKPASCSASGLCYSANVWSKRTADVFDQGRSKPIFRRSSLPPSENKKGSGGYFELTLLFLSSSRSSAECFRIEDNIPIR